MVKCSRPPFMGFVSRVIPCPILYQGPAIVSAERVNLSLLRPASGDLVERVLQPLPFAPDLLLARPQGFQALGHEHLHRLCVPFLFYAHLDEGVESQMGWPCPRPAR
jgi:hypothetical protein